MRVRGGLYKKGKQDQREADDFTVCPCAAINVLFRLLPSQRFQCWVCTSLAQAAGGATFLKYAMHSIPGARGTRKKVVTQKQKDTLSRAETQAKMGKW